MTLDPATLSAGHQFPRHSFSVTGEEVRQYLEAVGDQWPGYAQLDAVAPPLFLIAKGLGMLLAAIGLPPGSVHGSQECEFVHPVRPGTELVLEAGVTRAATRQGQRFVTVEMAAREDDMLVCRGRALLIIPGDARRPDRSS